MFRVLFGVVTITVAAFVTALPAVVDDPSGPHGLDPVQTLAPPPRYNYKKMKGGGSGNEYIDGQVLIGSSEEHISATSSDDEGSIIKIKIEKEKNLAMSVYLNQFEALGKKMEDQYSRDNMDVIKLLISHGWLYLMTPTKDDLSGFILVDKTKTLEDIRNDLVLEIKSEDKVTPVADALLWYANGIQEKLRADAENNIKTYNDMVISKKIINKISDPNMKERLTRENEAINAKLEENRIFREFNQITFKMCLMSYVLIFQTQPFLEDTFTVTSSDGHQTKYFRTPPLARNQFQQIAMEAEIELEEETSSLSESEVESLTLKEYRTEQNLLISKYFNKFEQIREKSNKDDEKSAYKIIKLLLFQSWIYMLNPNESLVKNIITVEPHKSTEDVRQDLIRELKETTIKSDIEDAINLYDNRLSQEVKNTLENQIKDLVFKLNSNIAEVEMLNAGPLKESKIIEKNKNLLKLEETRLNLQFHDMTLKMCLQSFVMNFVTPPYPSTVTINCSNGPSKEFPVPLLYSESFEQLYYETLSIVEEED